MTLVTRPLLSWWTRRMAVQPVVRKAELLRGGCSEEEATQINGRTLLMLGDRDFQWLRMRALS